MDARRTPGGIFNNPWKDQVTDFFGNSLPAARWVSGLAQLGPVPSESLAVPADHGLGHDEEERLFPLRPELESVDPKELVEHSEFWFGMSALRHDKLLSKSQVLQKQILSVANTAKGCSEPQAKQVEHGGRVIADEILACTPMLLISKPDRIVARERGDTRNELHAKVGRLRSEAETMSFVDLSRFLGEQLQNPIVKDDKELRLWCLIAKGYTDIEIDYRATKRDGFLD